MSKKKKISNQNYMDFIVVKNPEIEYETNDKGQVTVMIEWRGLDVYKRQEFVLYTLLFP